jgi:hypothetical protein
MHNRCGSIVVAEKLELIRRPEDYVINRDEYTPLYLCHSCAVETLSRFYKSGMESEDEWWALEI